MRQLGYRGVLAILIAVSLVGATAPPALAAGSSTGIAQRSAASPRLDGETIFRGLVFGQGPAAQLFPELANTPVATPEQAAAINTIVAEMRTLDPTFFDRFGRAMHSGSRVRVRAALEETNSLGQQAVSALNAVRDPGLAQQECLFVFIAGAVVLVVVAAGAAAVVAVVVWLWFWFWAPSAQAQAQSTLIRDQWSTKIATTLKA